MQCENYVVVFFAFAKNHINRDRIKCARFYRSKIMHAVDVVNYFRRCSELPVFYVIIFINFIYLNIIRFFDLKDLKTVSIYKTIRFFLIADTISRTPQVVISLIKNKSTQKLNNAG